MKFNNQQFILASSSKQRLEILNYLGIIPHVVVAPNIDETPIKKEKPYAFVKRISLQKAKSVISPNFTNTIVLAADTIMVKRLQIIGKPTDYNDAKRILTTLSGSRHKVITSFTILVINSKSTIDKSITKVVKTDVLLKHLSAQEIDFYLSTNEWQGKSGGYSIQGVFNTFVKQINGSILNVIGLPLHEVYNSLFGIGYIKSFKN